MQTSPPQHSTDRTKAARTIWLYWTRRFKHNTLWHLVDNARRLKITAEDTKNMR